METHMPRSTTLASLADTHLLVPDAWTGPIPVPDIDGAPFWQGLREHKLLIQHCAECGYWVHTPLAACPRCLSFDLRPEPVSGHGVLYSWTVCNRQFVPGLPPPYVAALIDLDEQPALRMVTMLVNCRIGDARIGMPVRVVYYHMATATLAFFEPHEPAAPAKQVSE
jgi:uncharacterized protein